MGRKVDMKGKVFGRWTVLEEAGRNKYGMVMWTCKCECGTIKDINGSILRQGDSHSCGCHKMQVLLNRITKHGMSGTRFHTIWHNMMRRCTETTNPSFENYGGRGIKVHPHWYEFVNFRDDLLLSYQQHVEEFGEKETTIDRIDVNGNYEPQNVRFATWNQQAKNRRVRSTNTSGVTGVVMNNELGKWFAQIFSDGVYKYLGSFDTFEEAVIARKQAEIDLGFSNIKEASE